MTTHNWLDKSLYPFEHNYQQLETGTMHYVDEGQGDAIVFLHGTPSWSFLYRSHIRALSKTHRCIAPDHLGFGLSEKPKSFAGTPQAHAKNLAEFIDKLGLDEFTLVVHDFGGPIGLSYAIQQPEKVKSIVAFNTWLWATKDNPDVQKIDRLINSWLGRFLYLRLNISPKFLLKQGFADKKKLSKNVHRHYTKPFPNKKSRYGLLKIARALAGESDWYAQQWQQLDALTDKNWLLLWGMQDSFIGPDYLQKWTERLPDAEQKTFDCGHFVQEEETAASIQAMQNFLARTDATTSSLEKKNQ